MPPFLTRRAFVADAAMTSAACAIKLDQFMLRPAAGAAALGRRTNFDEGWRFCRGDHGGDVAGAEAPDFADAEWRTLNLPHDWSIEGDFRADAAGGGTTAYLPTGIGWYRKQFTLPAATKGKRISLEFDGVYQRSQVWINGHLLGMRPYGFITFAYDLTPYLNATGKRNHIAVRVDNSLQPNCRWYSGSGIYRHTWLVITEPLHVARWGLQVATPAISTRQATVQVNVRVQNESTRPVLCELRIELLDAEDRTVARATAAHSIAANGEVTHAQAMEVAQPALWSPTNPDLYTARCTVVTNGAQIDQAATTFGIRHVAFDVDRGFLLNGEHIKLNGVCIHGDAGAVGTAVPERMWERRLQLLREMGCNAIRLSHNPPAPELLDMMDRMGFLVMAEAFDEWRLAKGQTPDYGYHKYFDQWASTDMAAMIDRDRNHPCIVIWSAGNEVPDQADASGPATLRRLKETIHQQDPTRLVTVACDLIAAEPLAALPEFLAELDVVGYNYVDRWRDRREKYYAIDRHSFPARRFIGTESTSPYGARGVYAIDQSNALFPEQESNTQIEVEQQQKFVQLYDYVAGDFLWTGIDYLGESAWPSKLAASGAMDTCGFKKDIFYFYQSLWTAQPVLRIATHWNWQGQQGDLVKVTCFTNCDTVELLLNGKSLGTKGFQFPRPGMVGEYGHYPPRGAELQTTADLHLSWDVAYEPGTLTAIGRKLDTVVQTASIETTGKPARLRLTADRETVSARPSDVAHVTVEVLDSAGRIVPTADDEITFSIAGSGKLLGLDNGRPDSHERYVETHRRAFNGMALAILQGIGHGRIVLSASAPTLEAAEIHIAVA